MHPIERLRYVARAGSAPDKMLVAESVPALAAFAHNPNALLVALKGLISRQRTSPGLLALGAHMMHSLEPIPAGWAFADELAADRTTEIAETVAIAEAGGTDVIDTVASGRNADSGEIEFLCPAGTEAWIDHAKGAGRSVVAVTPMGTRLPAMLWGRFIDEHDRVGGDDAGSLPGEFERLPATRFDDVIGPNGVTPLEDWEPDCPDVAEVARF